MIFFYHKTLLKVELCNREVKKISNKKTICPNCNHENKKEANFCVNCGQKLRESCKCWVTKQDNYSCGEESCPGYKLLVESRK